MRYEWIYQDTRFTAKTIFGVGIISQCSPDGSSLYDLRRIAINMGVFKEVYAVFSFRFFNRIAC